MKDRIRDKKAKEKRFRHVLKKYEADMVKGLMKIDVEVKKKKKIKEKIQYLDATESSLCEWAISLEGSLSLIWEKVKVII